MHIRQFAIAFCLIAGLAGGKGHAQDGVGAKRSRPSRKTR